MRRFIGRLAGLALLSLASLPAWAQVPLGNIRQYPINVTPAATAAAIGVSEQTFTATGVTLQDLVLIIPPAAATALCPIVYGRVTAANTVAFGIATLTAAACTPTAGVYNVVAFRN